MCRITHVAIENLMRLYVYGKCLVVSIYVSRSVSNSANNIIAIRSQIYMYMNVIKKMDPGKNGLLCYALYGALYFGYFQYSCLLCTFYVYLYSPYC